MIVLLVQLCYATRIYFSMDPDLFDACKANNIALSIEKAICPYPGGEQSIPISAH